MTLYLIRGLPGVGKSTLAERLVAYSVEADQFFVKEGVYQFDASQIKEAREFCQKKTRAFLENGHDVAVANTFTRRWEMEAYYDMAKELEVTVVEITVQNQMTDEELSKRCVHGVPVETIKRMRERWEQ